MDDTKLGREFVSSLSLKHEYVVKCINTEDPQLKRLKLEAEKEKGCVSEQRILEWIREA